MKLPPPQLYLQRIKNKSMQDSYAVELLNITKNFPGVLANDDVTLQVKKGQIHALVGENGAGKTTLMNILYGLVHPDSGQIRVDGREVSIRSPRDAIGSGLGMVHQHFMLVPSYTTTQNIFLGNEINRLMIVDQKQAEREVQEISEKYNLLVNPKAVVRDLPVGVQQRVEILKVLQRGANTIVLDEPTAVLTPQECDELFVIVRSLVADGKTVIIITHKLSEVKAISDCVTVLRRGKVIGTVLTKDVSKEELASMMVGSNLPSTEERKKLDPGEFILKTKDLVVRDKFNTDVVRRVSLSVRQGEIVTIAGVEGNGQMEFVEAVTGLRKVFAGQAFVCGQDVTNLSPDKVRQCGLAHVPGDRIATGTNVKASIADNLIAGRHRQLPFSTRGWINSKEKQKFSQDLVDRYKIKTPSLDVRAKTLSGGNLQKVVAAREMSFDTPLLVVVQPTRGLDIASTGFIHEILLEMRNCNKAILLVSTELDEVFELSDRILVMYEGEIVGEFTPENVTREELGLYMAGVKRQSRAESES